jgi:hypothetical protein
LLLSSFQCTTPSKENNTSNIFCISDDICVPDGGFKSNALIQAVLTILFRLEEFKGDGDGKGGGGEVKRQCREVTVFME